MALSVTRLCLICSLTRGARAQRCRIPSRASRAVRLLNLSYQWPWDLSCGCNTTQRKLVTLNDLNASGRAKEKGIGAVNRHPESNSPVYVGSIAFDTLTSRQLGSTRVDALGAWDLRTPRDSAVDAGQEPGTDTLVWIQSERGCQESSTFIVD